MLCSILKSPKVKGIVETTNVVEQGVQKLFASSVVRPNLEVLAFPMIETKWRVLWQWYSCWLRPGLGYNKGGRR
jgi:hypothetical protein